MIRFAVGVILVATVGCASTTLRANFMSNGMQRASFDLSCPNEQIMIARLDGGDLDAVMYSAGATIGTSGCDKKATYVLAPGGINGTWILNSQAK